MSKKKSQSKAPKTKLIIVLVGIVIVAMAGLAISKVTKRVNVGEDTRIYVPTGASYKDLCDTLAKYDIVPQKGTFKLMAKARGLDNHVKSGSYVVKPGMSYLQLIQKLYTGNQNPIRITIGKYRTLRQLCDGVAAKMEFTSDTLYKILTGEKFFQCV